MSPCGHPGRYFHSLAQLIRAPVQTHKYSFIPTTQPFLLRYAGKKFLIYESDDSDEID